VFRRIHKEPAEVPTEELLDFLVLLSFSDRYYGDFDPKSKAFVDESLNFVEDGFTGTLSTTERISRNNDVKI